MGANGSSVGKRISNSFPGITQSDTFDSVTFLVVTYFIDENLTVCLHRHTHTHTEKVNKLQCVSEIRFNMYFNHQGPLRWGTKWYLMTCFHFTSPCGGSRCPCLLFSGCSFKPVKCCIGCASASQRHLLAVRDSAKPLKAFGSIKMSLREAYFLLLETQGESGRGASLNTFSEIITSNIETQWFIMSYYDLSLHEIFSLCSSESSECMFSFSVSRLTLSALLNTVTSLFSNKNMFLSSSWTRAGALFLWLNWKFTLQRAALKLWASCLSVHQGTGDSL